LGAVILLALGDLLLGAGGALAGETPAAGHDWFDRMLFNFLTNLVSGVGAVTVVVFIKALSGRHVAAIVS
jgi:hypothetical protein